MLKRILSTKKPVLSFKTTNKYQDIEGSYIYI